MEEMEQLDDFVVWANQTADGSLADLNFQHNLKVWEEIC